MLGKLWAACAGLPVAVLFLGPPIWILSLLQGLPLLDLTMNAELISSLGNAPLSRKVIPSSPLSMGCRLLKDFGKRLCTDSHCSLKRSQFKYCAQTSGFYKHMLARILTPPANKKCQAQADQHMAAEAETLQTRWDMKEEIRGPIEKGAFISAPSSFYSIKCQGNTLLTSYLPNNDHNQNSSLL